VRINMRLAEVGPGPQTSVVVVA